MRKQLLGAELFQFGSRLAQQGAYAVFGDAHVSANLAIAAFFEMVHPHGGRFAAR